MTVSAYLSGGHLDRILLAAVLGAIIGWEREQHGRPAGLRTHMLVCIGAALMMSVSESMFTKYQILGRGSEGFLRVDPGRIAAQIITGIGFIGAGVIMKMGLRVQGLTTAACLWLAAGVGMAAGCALYVQAVFSTVLATAVLYYLGKLEKRIERDIHKMLTVVTKDNREALDPLRGILKSLNVKLSRYTYEEKMDEGISMYILNVKMRDPDLLMLVTQAVREKIANVTRIHWD